MIDTKNWIELDVTWNEAILLIQTIALTSNPLLIIDGCADNWIELTLQFSNSFAAQKRPKAKNLLSRTKALLSDNTAIHSYIVVSYAKGEDPLNKKIKEIGATSVIWLIQGDFLWNDEFCAEILSTCCVQPQFVLFVKEKSIDPLENQVLLPEQVDHS